MTNMFKWGIIGLGNIARKFTEGLAVLENAEIHAVASRSLDKSKEFARQYGVDHYFGDYEEMLTSAALDAVYIATPHSKHLEQTLMCLKRGIPVLCEKPVTINEKEIDQILAVAKQQKVFFMEAMWTRCFPLILEVKKLLNNAVIGKIEDLTCNFGYRSDGSSLRLHDPELGGGAFLDVGIYTVSMASLFLGNSISFETDAQLSDGIDIENQTILKHKNNSESHVSSSIKRSLSNNIIINGSEGILKIETPFWCPVKFTIEKNNEIKGYDYPLVGNGYHYEALEVMNCLKANKLESSLMTWNETKNIMKTMDSIRESWGLKYPME